VLLPRLSKRSHLQLVSWVAKTCTNTSRLVANTSHPVNNHYNSNPDIIWTNLVCVTWINFNTFLHFLTRAKNISPFHLELSSLISFWALFSNFSCTILLPVSPFVYFFSVTTFITLNFSYTVDFAVVPHQVLFSNSLVSTLHITTRSWVVKIQVSNTTLTALQQIILSEI